jgi:hypothetical protein
MSTLRVSNIEAKADPSSPSVNEKVKITNSNGDVMLQLDGATSGITTVGINTTGNAFTVDANQNINFTGIVTAASLSGNLTGNVTGNADTATTATNALGLSTSQLNIGSSFVNANAIGIGSTDTAGRNAGVGTANGTIIFNAETYALEVFGSVAGWETVKQLNNFLVNVPVSNTSTDTTSRSGYTVITYTGPGSFNITAGTKTIEYLVVAGGGSGGGGIPTYAGGGGGGAGGFRTGSWTGGGGENYTITVGGGGSPSSLIGPGISITSARGGVGGVWSGGSVGPGGSGGGGVNNAEAGGTGNSPPTSPPQGNPGEMEHHIPVVLDLHVVVEVEQELLVVMGLEELLVLVEQDPHLPSLDHQYSMLVEAEGEEILDLLVDKVEVALVDLVVVMELQGL